MAPSTPDIRNSDVNEAINQALEVAPQTFARVDSAASGDKAAVGGVSLELKEPTDTELRQGAPAVHSRFHKEVASPESSTAQTGTTGMAARASVDVPEEIEVYPQDATEKGFPESSEAQVVTLQSRGSLISGVVTGAENETKAKLSTGGEPQTLTDGVIVDEHLALALDEGQNSSNAWRLHEHVQHGLDRLTRTVEGVLIRGKVIESELVEVSQ